jgi:hypothetical protein
LTGTLWLNDIKTKNSNHADLAETPKPITSGPAKSAAASGDVASRIVYITPFSIFGFIVINRHGDWL